MTVLRVGDRRISAQELLPLLTGYQLMPQLLRELLVDQAIAPIALDPQETEQACQHFAAQCPELQSVLSPEQWQHFATRSRKLEKFKHATWDRQIEAYFFQRKAQFDKVIYSLIRVQHQEIAQELFFRLQANEQSFAELAREYSQGPEAQTGGVIGPVELSAIHPLMAQRFATISPQRVQPPMRLGEWIVLLQLEQLIPASLDASTQQRLLNELFDQWLQTQLQQVSVSPIAVDSSVPTLVG